MNLSTPSAVTSAVFAVALDVLSARLLTLLAMLLSAGLAAWSMWQPDWMRLATLAIFGITIFLPIIKLETQQKEQQK